MKIPTQINHLRQDVKREPVLIIPIICMVIALLMVIALVGWATLSLLSFIYSLIVENTMEAIAWATSVFLIITVICITVLISNRMAEETRRQKNQLELGQSDTEIINNDAKLKQIELENENLRLTKELESARHVQEIDRSKRGI